MLTYSTRMLRSVLLGNPREGLAWTVLALACECQHAPESIHLGSDEIVAGTAVATSVIRCLPVLTEAINHGCSGFSSPKACKMEE